MGIRGAQLIDITDIRIDSRESLYFGITLLENGIVFEVTIKLIPHFQALCEVLQEIAIFYRAIPTMKTSIYKSLLTCDFLAQSPIFLTIFRAIKQL